MSRRHGEKYAGAPPPPHSKAASGSRGQTSGPRHASPRPFDQSAFSLSPATARILEAVGAPSAVWRSSSGPPLRSPQPGLLLRPASGAGTVGSPYPRRLSLPSARRVPSRRHHGFPSTARRRGLPLSSRRCLGLRSRPSSAASAARGRRKCRGDPPRWQGWEEGEMAGRAPHAP